MGENHIAIGEERDFEIWTIRKWGLLGYSSHRAASLGESCCYYWIPMARLSIDRGLLFLCEAPR
jgi:hypothetical protein